MQDISNIIVDLLIENDEKYKRLEAENAEMQQQIDAVYAERHGYCDCGCGRYFFCDFQPTGYWCNECNKYLSWYHRDPETGDYCTICDEYVRE